MNKFLLSFLLLSLSVALSGQTADSFALAGTSDSVAPDVLSDSVAIAGRQAESADGGNSLDFFMGADLSYRCIMLNGRIYDLLLNLSPAVKWRFGSDWLISAQAFVPVINQYGEHYKYLRINVADISKEISAGNNYFKFSAGLFSRQRYGFDAKWLWAVCNWFALEGQVGITGVYKMWDEWGFSKMDRLTGQLSARFFLESSNTELRLVGGRYIYGDYGAKAMWLQHFSNFLSVGAYAQWGDKYGTSAPSMMDHLAGGAVLVMALPLQGKPGKKVRFRLADNFRLTYDYNADGYAVKMYDTDPEENERSGNFRRAKWGF